jgi:di/tripeptidase
MINNNAKIFETICKKTQPELKKFVTEQLTKRYPTVLSTDGFVYAQGTTPILLVAHLDTVHKATPEVLWYDPEDDSLSSPQGIGGDDRCGVYIILEIIKKHNCSVLFCEDEEIGAVGAEKFVKTKLAKELRSTFNYIIEFDRKGSNDAVFYDCANWDFEDFITKEFYKLAYGSFSDISVLAPELECAAVNLSCGYYNAHTTGEYVVWEEMCTAIKEGIKLIERTTEADKFEYIEYEYDSRYRDEWEYWGKGKDKYAEDQYIIIYTDECGRSSDYATSAVSMEEAIGKFCISTLRSFNDIIDIEVY